MKRFKIRFSIERTDEEETWEQGRHPFYTPAFERHESFSVETVCESENVTDCMMEFADGITEAYDEPEAFRDLPAEGSSRLN